MTAKRFTVDSDGKYWDRESNKYVTIDHLFYLVEKLEKENEQLKTDNGAFIQDIEVFKEENTHLKLENEQLQSRCNDYDKALKTLQDLADRKLKENEELKQLLDYADDLIQSHLSEHFIRQWRNFKTGHKEYNDFWEEKLKTHKELNEDME